MFPLNKDLCVVYLCPTTYRTGPCDTNDHPGLKIVLCTITNSAAERTLLTIIQYSFNSSSHLLLGSMNGDTNTQFDYIAVFIEVTINVDTEQVTSRIPKSRTFHELADGRLRAYRIFGVMKNIPNQGLFVLTNNIVA